MVKIPFSLPVSRVACINNNRNVIMCFESIFYPLFNETNIVQIHQLNIPIFPFLIFPLVWNIWLVLLDHQSKIYQIEVNWERQYQHESLVLKFVALLKEREVNRKRQKFEAWNTEIFGPSLEQTLVSSLPNEKVTSRLKPLLECTLKHPRNRMANLLDSVREYAEHEEITPKQVAALLLMMVSNDEKDYTVSNICKEIVANGIFGSTKRELKTSSCSFLLDFLSLGRGKYAEFRRFMKLENVTMTSYTKLTLFHSQVNLLNELKFVTSSLNQPIGITIPYRDILATTVHQLIEFDESLQNASYPINVTVVDGLDGSGSHRIYNQLQDHPDISTKSFLLFCFRIVYIKDSAKKIIWKNPVPNSPFAVRPLSLFAVPENENNVRFLMDRINVETEYIQANGFQLPQGKCDVRIERAMFDTKMAGILDGAGGAACHLCTATREQWTDKHLIQHGFPINRSIQQAREIFLEVDEDEFLSRPPSTRFNITHQPISAIDILPASPLHGYIRIFSWLMNLSYHIQAGATKWSPTSPVIESRNYSFATSCRKKQGLKSIFRIHRVGHQPLEMLQDSAFPKNVRNQTAISDGSWPCCQVIAEIRSQPSTLILVWFLEYSTVTSW